MSNPAPTLTPPLDDPEQDIAYCRAINLRIIQVGANLIDSIDQPETRDQIPLKQRTETYERTSRSVRRAILVVERLARLTRDAQRAQAQPGHQIVQARLRIQRDVEDTIVHEVHDPADAEDLRLELLERLEEPELDVEILTRPVAEITDDFRRDLGVAQSANSLRPPRYRRRTPEDVAELRANAYARAIPFSPLPTPMPTMLPGAHRPAPIALKEN